MKVQSDVLHDPGRFVAINIPAVSKELHIVQIVRVML